MRLSDQEVLVMVVKNAKFALRRNRWWILFCIAKILLDQNNNITIKNSMTADARGKVWFCDNNHKTYTGWASPFKSRCVKIDHPNNDCNRTATFRGWYKYDKQGSLKRPSCGLNKFRPIGIYKIANKPIQWTPMSRLHQRCDVIAIINPLSAGPGGRDVHPILE